MKIGILGAGKIGSAIARHLVKVGYEVILSNSRGAESLGSLLTELGPLARWGTSDEAASQRVVFVSVVWAKLPEVLGGVPAWEGRIVVDTTNPYVSDPSGFRLLDTGDQTSSEMVAEMVPGARLVKAFNSMPAAVLAKDPHADGGRRVAFVSGNDEGAKGQVIEIAGRMGFAPIDVGNLAVGGRLMQAGHPLAGLNLVSLA